MSSGSFAAQLQPNTHNFLQYFPIISSPALQSGEYEVDRKLILIRAISGAALAAIAMTALYWICPPAIALLFDTPLTLIGAVILPNVPLVVEIWRAYRAADQLAVKEYIENPIPSHKATYHICSNPRAFQILLDRKENLNKLDSKGMSLTSKILDSWSFANSKVRHMLIDSDIDLLAVGADGLSPFRRAVKSYSSDVLEFILKSGKIKAADINEQEQAAIWKDLGDDKGIEVLRQHGFNIDAQDAEGATPLMYWAKQHHPHFILAALNAKANPLLTDSLGLKASEFVRENSLLQWLLQAETQFEENIPLPKEKGFMSYLPWKPFVCKNDYNFSTDSNALTVRVQLVGLAAILMVPFAPSLALGAMAISIPLWISQEVRSTKEAKRLAVVEYLTSAVPSKQSSATIRTSAAAARLLIEHAPDATFLNKLNEKGEHLLSYGINPEVFKLLIERDADIFAGIERNGFSFAVENSNSAFMAYILDRKLVNVEEMPAEQQVKMWSSVGSAQTASFLKNYGFNPNVADAKGNTALMRLAQQKSVLGDVPLDKIQALLSVGADPQLKNHEGKTAKDLTTDPRIVALF